MKISITFLFLIFSLCFTVAQTEKNNSTKSIIHKNNGEEIDAIILEISETEVRYRPFDNPLGPDYVMHKSAIFKVIFPNGKEEVYFGKTFMNTPNKNIKGLEIDETSQNAASGLSTQAIKDLQFQAIRDANRYYEPRGIGVATSLTTFFFWPAGLATTLGVSLTPPAMHRLNIRDNELFENPIYFETYRNEARRMKSRKAWGGFGIGAGALLILLIAVSAR